MTEQRTGQEATQGQESVQGQESAQEPVQAESQQMSLQTLETHIQEAEELHRSLTRRLDETSRD